MKQILIILAMLMPLAGLNCQNASSNSSQTAIVLTGIEVLRERNFDVLQNKRIGLVTNATGVDSKLVSTVDILNEAEGLNLVALFGPEHGVRGDHSAGDIVESNVDAKTGKPVFSLYGSTRKPNAEMLKGIDVLVYDIQDIGSRSYTFISTMGLVMEAAAENNIEVVVLDRPNPLGGQRIEGCLVENGFESFVSQYKIPYIYGLTCGELAQFLNNEGYLNGNVKCKLTVVPMKGWTRAMVYKDTGLPWVMPSPHIPHPETAFYYAATGIVGELDPNLIGVGYTVPFETFVAEWINSDSLALAINKLALPGVTFRPISFKPYYMPKQGKQLHGVQVYITDYTKVALTEIQFRLLEVHHSLYPAKEFFALSPTRWNMFDKVAGTSKIRELFTKNHQFSDVNEYWNKDVEVFRDKAKKYYLYH